VRRSLGLDWPAYRVSRVTRLKGSSSSAAAMRRIGTRGRGSWQEPAQGDGRIWHR
jgi:hypothetical protein